jgi:hypothetical protein
MRYFDRYLCLSKKFDYVYCADNACKDEFRKHGVNACLLLPCVQPLIFNPLKTRSQNISDDGDSFYSYALFNGWADIDRFENHYSKIFDNEIIGSMRIIESRCIITRNRVEGLERYSKSTLGNVCLSQKARLIRDSKMYVLGDESISDDVDKCWEILQGMASRVPVMMLSGKTSNGSPIFETILNEEVGQFKRYLNLFEKDELLRQKYGHLSWREATSKHTFNNRLNQILGDIGEDKKIRPEPLISLITPTRRLANINTILANFDRQVWPHKELILVANLDQIPDDFVKPKEVSSFSKVPQNCFAGDALNEGITKAKGKYVFRIDDDDEYYENYCYDMVLAAESWSLDFLGKVRNLFYSFEDSKNVFLLEKKDKKAFSCNFLPDNESANFKITVSGNSFMGKKSFFTKERFLEGNYSAADVFFQDNLNSSSFRLLGLDPLNLVVERRFDQSTHTWKVSKNELLASVARKGLMFYSNLAAKC